jgi:hypothetical protein
MLIPENLGRGKSAEGPEKHTQTGLCQGNGGGDGTMPLD